MDYNVAQLDFVLEMASQDSPDRIKFSRPGTQTQSSAMAEWTKVLRGPMGLAMLAHTGITAATQAVQRYLQRRNPSAGLKPGITRGGKPVDGNDSSSPGTAGPDTAARRQPGRAGRSNRRPGT